MERFWASLAEMAAERGGEAIVATPELRSVSEILRNAPLYHTELRIPTGWKLPDREVLSLLTKNRVRTVYLTDRKYWSPMYLWFRACGVRSIILHDHVPGERPKPAPLRLGFKRARWLLPWGGANLYIGVSEFVRDRFIEVGGVPPRLCTFVRNGVSTDSTRETKDIRKELDIPEHGLVVVSVGRAHPYKGISFMIQCAERLILSERMDSVYFVHIGDGPELARLKRTVRQRGLSGRFIFMGNRSDVPSLLPSCDVAFHASRGEAFSLAILEFMAAGIPAVVPDHCGNAEAIEQGVTGFLFPPGNHQRALEHLKEMLQNPVKRRTLGGEAQRRAQADFSLEVMDREFRDTVMPFLSL
jgi:glycosyltransferase involved in cell wall biosynthesis